jgi:uncharacterized membrane protein
MTGSAGDTAAAESPVMRRPRWLAPVSLLLVIGGLGVSAYMTYEHFTENATLVCTIGGVVDCAKVTTSSWAYFLGIPVAVLGLVFFAVALFLVLPRTWRRNDPWIDRGRMAWLSIGLAMVLYLVWAEFFQIGAICSWCTVVHIITFALWVAVMFGQILSEPAGDPSGTQLEDVEQGS